MNSKYKYLIKNTLILTLSNFSSKLLVFFLIPLYTRALSTAEYGTYDLAISTVQLLFPILTINIVDAVMRFIMEKDCDEHGIVTISIRLLIGSMIIIAILLGMNHYFSLWNEIHGFELYIFIYYVMYVLNQFFNQFAKGLERITDMAVAGVIGTAATLLSNVVFLIVIKIGLTGYFIANIIGLGLPVIYYMFRTRVWKYISWQIDKELQKEMLVYSAPLVLSTVAWWINSASDRYVVSFFCGVAANGVLAVAYKIPSILNVLIGTFGQAWQVSAIKEYDSDDRNSFFMDAFVYLNMLICVGAGGLIFFTRPLAHILYAKDFYDAWQYVPFLILSSVFNTAAGFVGPILSAKKDSKSMAKSALYGASINVLLNILFVYFIGVQGATIATVISSAIIYIVRKRAAKEFFASEKYKWIILSWIILIIQAVAEVYIANYIITFAMMLPIMWIYKNSIKNLITIVHNKVKRKDN